VQTRDFNEKIFVPQQLLQVPGPKQFFEKLF